MANDTSTPIRTSDVTFRGSLGHDLSAKLDEPAGKAEAWALFAHCFTCSKDVLAAARVSRGLAARGVATLRFDFTGLGNSGGTFGETGFASNVADLLAAAAWLRDERAAPALLVGHSLGGAAVLAAAGDVPEARAVATIGAPAEPGHALEHLGAGVAAVERDGRAEVSIGGRPFTVGRALVDELRAAEPAGRVADLGRRGVATLFLHAPGDNVVGVDNAAELFGWARHPKSFVSLADADHLLTRPADAAYAAEVLAAWASRYV